MAAEYNLHAVGPVSRWCSENYLIPPSLLESKESVVRFTDVAAAAGLNRHGMAGGLIVDDFDNDGLFDAVISSQDDCVPLQLLPQQR